MTERTNEAAVGMSMEERLLAAIFGLPCSGASDCLAPIHGHGCFADTDGSACDDPGDHAPAHPNPEPPTGDGEREGVGECGCYACIGNQPTYPGSWITVGMSQMIVCSECGNKRCPHGTDHRNDCTGSNDPQQPGSRYGGLPTQPAANQESGA